MAKLTRLNKSTFENILRLIQEARSRAFSKVNAELVLLYFNVGQIVSEKVAAGVWGDNTVDDLALYIESKIPELKSFNRRGLYRMKQFYETYAAHSECANVWAEIQRKNVKALPAPSKRNKSKKVIVSPAATQLKSSGKSGKTLAGGAFEIVSPAATQFQNFGCCEKYAATFGGVLCDHREYNPTYRGMLPDECEYNPA